MRQKLLLLIFLLTTLISSVSAQTNNPANIILTGTGRYCLKLSDYATSMPSMLTMTLTVSDATISNMPVKFMLTISNANYKFTTKLSNVRPITIHGGQTYVLYCSDLAEYFNPNNINFNGYKYQSIGQLPEGNNKLQVYLINQITGKRISNIASLNMYATLASAPALRKPANNSTFESTSQNPTINFEWKQPSNSYSINTKYKFQLFEIQNDNISLNTIADGTNPFYESEVNNTPYFNLNTALLNLKIGKKYAWRVIASDVNEIQKFKNDGKSEIFTFQYLTPPIPVNGLSVKVVNRNMNFSWEANQNQSSFDVEYYDYQTGRTISGNIPENRIQLSAPKSDYKIKFRVRAICYGDEKRKSDWTPWLEAQVAKAPERDTNFVCGKVFPDREITNLELKTVFQEGEILESKNGDTRYEMVGVSENNNGVLSGQFYMIMDCWGGAKILCDFTDTKINTDNIVLTTRFSNHPFPDYVVDPEDIKNYVKDLWLNGNSLATSTKIRDTIVISQKFDYLYANENGKLIAVVVNNDGSTTETEVNPYKSPNQCLVTDGKGDSLVIDKNGRPMGISEYRATGGNKALLNEYHRKKDSAALWYVNFLPYKKQEYSFDYLTSGDHGIFATDEYYPKSGNYDFRYKSVATSTTDRVIVDFDSYLEKDSVVFKDKYGVKLKLSKGNILTFTSTSTADTNYIYAYDKNDVKIGKLIVKTYAKKTINLTLVKVNNSTCPKISEIEKYLNKVYKCANVEFKVSAQEFSIPELKTFSHGGSKWTSVYNEDQQKVLEFFDSKMIKDEYYLFFIDNVLDKKDSLGTAVAGYMPRGYNAGFIYDGGSPRTIAHEIGHGAFALEHVFRNSSNSGKTKNLMDYSTGEELYHFQWDNCQDPKRVWMKWKKDEGEGESVEKKDTTFVFRIKGTNYEAISGSEMYVIQQMRNLDLQLYKDDELINGVWCVDNQTTKGENLSLDFSKVDTLNISVKDSFGVKLANFKLNIYAKPEVKFELLPSYKGEFGFDNYFENPNTIRIAMYSQYQKFSYLDKNKAVPIATVSSNKNILLNMIVDVSNDFQKDTNAFIRITSTDNALQFRIINHNSDLLSNKNLVNNSSFLNLEVKSSDALSNYQYIIVFDQAKDTIAKLAVLSQSIEQDKNLHVYYISDTILSNNSTFDTTYFNNYSYNQAFVNFNINVNNYQFKNDFMYKMSKNNDNWKQIADSIYSTFLSEKGIDIRTSNDLYLFLVPIKEFTYIDKGQYFSMSGFCDSQSLTSTAFFNDVFLSNDGRFEQIGVHELGHALKLTHIFDKPYSIIGNKTNNYMNYSGPNKMNSFCFFQWKLLNPNIN